MIDVSIRVTGESRDAFDRIVQQLVAAGLMNPVTSKRLGLANGSVDGQGLDALRGVKGVESVRQASGSAPGADGGPAPAPRKTPPIEFPRSGGTLMVV